ncbi:putative hAT family C-terminal dimerisation region [Lyophyllum shimeji]|uniref:HAT family C-terminal dimerisation region n=1 Tax=Lyophyllum shimeji TaxID=47721 RepID=A0A9P3Q0X3_LYOSH|nr:putative hAT family C-terminal dimerisation region [Lyophyllum shimeji]GLB45629.1 putative hAT family C-terminal dimerisation region [Lyophyllum shimeji]
MDHIDKVLTTLAHNTAYDPAIRSSLALGKKTLDRYYSLTDSSEVYRIAMVLHPRYKLQYFKNLKWKPRWIETAMTLVRDEYERRKGEFDDDAPVEKPPTSEPTQQSSSKRPNVFDNLPTLSAPAPSELRDELDRYLSTDVENVKNVLLWWREHKAMYPVLSRMALDYLTIPATSVDVERVFSRGRLLLSHVRSRLSAQTTRALLCLGSWSLLGLVKDTDVLAVSSMNDVEGDADAEIALDDGWDSILL